MKFKKIIYLAILFIVAATGFLITKLQKRTQFTPKIIVDYPPRNLEAIEKIVRDAGWTVQNSSFGPDGRGCLEATKQDALGKICFHPCNGEGSAVYAKQWRVDYGYHIGKSKPCDFYTVVTGDPEFRTILFARPQ